MKKYLQIFKIGMKEMFAYRFDVFGKGVLGFFKICIAYLMWRIIYSMNDIVSGYTFHEMITYYLLVNFLLAFETSSEVSKLMSEEIKNGYFTKYIVKPVNTFGYYFSLIISKIAFLAIVNTIAMGVWLLVFRNYFELHLSFRALSNSIFIFILGLLFIALLNYFFMILTFWVIDTTAFFMIKDNIMEFVTGALVPFSLLPAYVIEGFKYTPFYYILYYPVNICIRGDLSEVHRAFFVLVISCVVLLVIDHGIYKFAIKSYEGVGI